MCASWKSEFGRNLEEERDETTRSRFNGISVFTGLCYVVAKNRYRAWNLIHFPADTFLRGRSDQLCIGRITPMAQRVICPRIIEQLILYSIVYQ